MYDNCKIDDTIKKCKVMRDELEDIYTNIYKNYIDCAENRKITTCCNIRTNECDRLCENMLSVLDEVDDFIEVASSDSLGKLLRQEWLLVNTIGNVSFTQYVVARNDNEHVRPNADINVDAELRTGTFVFKHKAEDILSTIIDAICEVYDT